MKNSFFDFPQVSIQKPIRLIEAFGGIGSQAMALRDIGANFEHYRLIEFDKYAVASYNAIHGTNFVTTDVRNIHGADLGIVEKDKYEYIFTYSFPCFVADTLVLTSKGLKKIADVKAGDRVLTYANTYKAVIFSRKTGEKRIFKVRGMGIDEIRCTENHKFYTRKMIRHYPYLSNGKRTTVRAFENPEWTECKNLTKKDYLGIAINQNSIVPNWNGIDFTWADGRKPRHKSQLEELMGNHSFWWIVGRYLGDGWFRSQGGIIICCSKSEMQEILPHLRNCGFDYSISEERTVNKIHIPLKELSLFLEPFGRGAENKEIPGFVFDMPVDLLQSFIDGYISTDGYMKNNLYKIASVSRKLIYGVAQLVAKAFKTPYRIYKTKRKPTCIIEGRICNQKDSYELVFKTKKKNQDKAFYEDGFIWFPIKSVEETDEIEPVYDLEVEDDHSFTANGVVVHNCTDLSVAGKMAGMSKKDWESGNSTRSGLLWEVERILSELHNEDLPQVLVMENVPQVHAEKNKADFDSWLEYLRKRGYQNFWKDLNAKDYGIPQNRERCFCVSVLSNEFIDYDFPEPIPLESVMKDLLENDVDEKYYIKSEKADNLIQQLIDNGTIGREKMPEHSVDLCVKSTGEINVANCIKARYDSGISNFGSDGTEIIEEKKTVVMSSKKIRSKQNENVANTILASYSRGIGGGVPMANGVIEYTRGEK